MILLNILVLVFEILYYSMFMYYAKGERKFKRYLLLFLLETIIIIIFKNNFYTYLIFILTSYIGLKYIVKTRFSLYDMLIIIFMLFLKIILEYLCYLSFLLINYNYLIFVFLIALIKIIVVYNFRKTIKNIYYKLKNRWNKNDFYIRYFFNTAMFIYIIITVILTLIYDK